MSRFLVLNRAPVSAREQIGSATPEQQQAGTQLWETWTKNAGPAL